LTYDPIREFQVEFGVRSTFDHFQRMVGGRGKEEGNRRDPSDGPSQPLMANAPSLALGYIIRIIIHHSHIPPPPAVVVVVVTSSILSDQKI
jgi:hypothetical protein